MEINFGFQIQSIAG